MRFLLLRVLPLGFFTCSAFVSITPSKLATSLKIRPLLASNSDLEESTKTIPKWKKAAAVFSQTAAVEVNDPYNSRGSRGIQLMTFIRVGIPSAIAGMLGTFLFPAFSLFLASIMNDTGVFKVLSVDSSQFVQNFLTVAGLLFSILVGQTYYFMYQQQEAVYYALFNEVTEAKSLVEQVALVCQGRAMYRQVLKSISQYVSDDLKNLQADPAVLLSARPVDDPLESVMYMTSVGVPSSVYETVRSLRQARAGRLGALQRKLPEVHMVLLWILGLIELVSFPLLGAGTQTIGGYRILTVEGILFGVMTFGIVMTLRVVGELWRPAGGAYNVDGVLSVMVSGLEEELDARMSGSKVYAANRKRPTRPIDEDSPLEEDTTTETDLPILQQGFDPTILIKSMKQLGGWLVQKARKSRLK
mmetsp:Transcript_20038/g.29715  ORF Transcript_20038/g.29715 Transcript_20038/m.29715 type:complete len:415 (+) Transcript_20038:154-1398(+)|eukprot:CAMPEP_0194202420 /NCGR_PEP_ID=MMETSP0156-20130528/2442_1 /TAXON_ID=33649 /ORGANISM="Thalassionema nitzschioides, Strain L26-B" /LENGTH=414 /DNA_ID=CAMNT_0038927903 /DNA_START=92 /DNA_END=1336 /DNA_ORIENTATION=-